MKHNPLELWTNFKSAFGQALNESGREELEQMWRTVEEKTSFYEHRLMPAVAKILGLKLAIEHQRTDYTFMDGNDVPLIAVESENAHRTASREINCLCSLAAPLKVLVISCDWKDGEDKKCLPGWQEIIRAHHAVVSVDCRYGIVVGEWDTPQDAPLEYSFTLLDTSGGVVDVSHHSVPI